MLALHEEKAGLPIVPEVVYLGHKIDAAPKNVAELKSYVGLLSVLQEVSTNLVNLSCTFVLVAKIGGGARLNSRHCRL